MSETSGLPPPVPSSGEFIFCTVCGRQNRENNHRCVGCGKELHAGRPSVVAAPDGLTTLIPYKNVKALVAYYLGVFALIPCFGLVLGSAALVLGILGLKAAARNPEAKGKAHAWAGIILGGLCVLANAVMIVAVVKMKVLE